MAQLINSLETKIGYTFRNPHLCHEALTTAGVPFQGSIAHGHLDGNSSLAFIGDSVLQLGVGRRSRELHETKGNKGLPVN
jgi:dsRNA-specific ribonuclease